MTEQQLLTVAQVMERMHAKQPQTVIKHIRSGALRATKPGRRWLISEADLQQFIDEAANRAPRRRRQRRVA